MSHIPEESIMLRIEEVSNENIHHPIIGEYLDEFNDKLVHLVSKLPNDLQDFVLDLEVLMSHLCLLSEDLAYRKGLNDGLNVQKLFRGGFVA
ncbi:hypothetical protein [Paenibacillus sp. 1P03SA]|uniref:hypothetical protein n=1 Tax=Paenibacillus sp. 1P03SA TaxID=3132294 RepID=UPI0039A22E50